MATDDDDILTSPVPEPDAEPTAAERAHAKTFADLVDKTLSGRTPPAMSADDRALLEVATVLRATRGALELGATRRHELVEGVLRQAIGAAGPTAGASGSGAAVPAPVTSIAAARRRRGWVPWAIAGASAAVAAAAIVTLWVRAPGPAPAPGLSMAAEQATPASWRSRAADPLVGPIARERAGEASERIDYLFADRLDGYRERRLSGRGGRR